MGSGISSGPQGMYKIPGPGNWGRACVFLGPGLNFFPRMVPGTGHGCMDRVLNGLPGFEHRYVHSYIYIYISWRAAASHDGHLFTVFHVSGHDSRRDSHAVIVTRVA